MSTRGSDSLVNPFRDEPERIRRSLRTATADSKPFDEVDLPALLYWYSSLWHMPR